MRTKPEDYHFIKTIGEGSFSTVYLCREIATKRLFAMKVCRKDFIIKENKVEYVKREKDAYKLLEANSKASCPFFVRLACSFQDAECLYYALSFAEKGDLLQYLRKNGSMNVPCAKFYAGELLHALEHIHSLGIIHRDIKPENILFNASMHIQISDFGSAKILKSPLAPLGSFDMPPKPDENEGTGRRRRFSFVGTAQYVSPEILNNANTTAASDLWALGAVLYQLVSNVPPFVGQAEYYIFQKILKLEYKFPDKFPPAAKDLVQKLLVLEPSKRLGATDHRQYVSIKTHEFFRDVDFEKLYLQTPPAPADSYPGPTVPSALLIDGEKLVPGLSRERMLQMEFDTPPAKTMESQLIRRKLLTDVTPEEIQKRLDLQAKNNVWHKFTQGNLILKQVRYLSLISCR
jgi:3-phosphoinositide dependent protein kinase-1